MCRKCVCDTQCVGWWNGCTPKSSTSSGKSSERTRKELRKNSKRTRKELGKNSVKVQYYHEYLESVGILVALFDFVGPRDVNAFMDEWWSRWKSKRSAEARVGLWSQLRPTFRHQNENIGTHSVIEYYYDWFKVSARRKRVSFIEQFTFLCGVASAMRRYTYVVRRPFCVRVHVVRLGPSVMCVRQVVRWLTHRVRSIASVLVRAVRAYACLYEGKRNTLSIWLINNNGS